MNIINLVTFQVRCKIYNEDDDDDAGGDDGGNVGGDAVGAGSV